MKTFFITIATSLFIIIGLSYYTYKSSIKDPLIVTFKNKYSYSNIDKHCEWSEKTTYMSCIKNDFYRIIRNSNNTQRQYMFILYKQIFDHNHYKHTTNQGRMISYLDGQDLLNHFLVSSNNLDIRRNHIDFVGIVLTYYYRNKIISLFNHNFSQLQEKIEKNYHFINQDPLIKSYSTFVTKEAKRISELINTN